MEIEGSTEKVISNAVSDDNVNNEDESEVGTKEDLKDNMKIRPDWYGSVLQVDASELEDLTYQKVGVWENSSEKRLVTKIVDGDEVVPVGYREDNDYCQIEFNGNQGWLACAWLVNLPNDMIDFWE